MGDENLTHLQVAAFCNHNHLCKQSFLGFLVVRSFNLYLLVEVSKNIELGFLHGVVEFYIWRITFERLLSESFVNFFANIVSLVADHSVLQKR